MLAKIRSIPRTAWLLLAAMAVMAAGSIVVRSTGVVSSTAFLYAVQPVAALAVCLLAWGAAGQQKDRVRHRSDKAFLVGSVLAVWFVLYFLSGLVTTYNHNSLVAGPKSIFMNIWAFGVVAFAIEYIRHKLMLLAGRRNVIWFGVIVAVVLAVLPMNLVLLQQTHGLDALIKLGVSDFMPAVSASFLLTYLTITAGLPAVLVYRLGLVGVAVLTPIIPKYDWYLQGVSPLLLAMCIYLAIDRNRENREVPIRHHRHRPRLAYNIMWYTVIAFLAIFMAGFFTYKPSAILSNSMKPVFSRGSMVIVQKTNNPMDVHVGDIVQYRRESITITHRVLAIDAAADGSGKRVFTTKGDDSPSKDSPVSESQIIGVVRAQIPLVGYPTAWLAQLSNSAGTPP